jgi:hypothetical protein
LLLYTIQLIKNPSFPEKQFIKKKKALQQMPKGWKWSGSPNRTIFELFA